MRILLTSHRFWPHVGGTEEAVAQLAAAFARRGHDVTVATSLEPRSPEEETRDGYRIRRFALRRVGALRLPPRAYRDFVLDGGWSVAHLHGQRVWSTDYLYPHLAKSRAPVVVTPHGFYQWHVERRFLVDAAYYKQVLPRALREAAAVTALTEPERDEMVAWGVPRDLVRVVPDGHDPREFEQLPAGFRERHGIAKDARLLLYVGGFYPNKRVDRLVRAAAEAHATLAVVGKDAHAKHGRAECEALAAHLGADMRALGRLPREDVLAAYRESDLFALASDFEGFGLVLLEAMASGLPFVATPTGAAPDLAREGGGVVADAAGLPRATKKLLDDPRRLRDIGRRGQEVAPRYTWSRTAERYLALYEEVGAA